MAKSVLFLDQLDSFSYNIVHLLESILGDAHSVAVIRYDDELDIVTGKQIGRAHV